MAALEDGTPVVFDPAEPGFQHRTRLYNLYHLTTASHTGAIQSTAEALSRH